MSNDQQYKQTLTALTESATPALRSAVATERAAALESVRANLLLARDAEVERLARVSRDRQADHALAVARLESQVEAVRRERSDAIIKQAFGEHGLPGLIAEWRREPGRQATVAIQKLWRELNAVAQVELGDELGVHLLTAAFVDALAAEFPEVRASTRLANVDDGQGVSARVIGALGAWSNAVDAGPGSAALEQLEIALLSVARSASTDTFGPQHAERVALRRQYVTRRDYDLAVGSFNERERARQQAQFEKNFVPPPPLRRARAGFNDGYVTGLEPTRGN